MVKLTSYIIAFLLGILSCLLILLIINNTSFLTGNVVSASSLKQAPSNWISDKDIFVYPDKIVIKVKNATLSNYGDTGSMKPVLDTNSNGIRITPESSDEIKVGDIVSFKQDSVLIVHRVVEKGTDENGPWFITQGDNNQAPDQKIRFNQIKYITIGVLW